ncbi:hypothetical protein [Streptomyces sp. NBC_00078]|nr:hypothetical protein [Streptomyces sp. NBC_00078]MCX5422839.1 hypothetical protein [Streptomyces sp. NBC_00078]
MILTKIEELLFGSSQGLAAFRLSSGMAEGVFLELAYCPTNPGAAS